jgi:excisionase family DNA binding protein
MQNYEAVSMPDSESAQVQELYRMLQVGAPAALVGENGADRIELPPSVYRLLREVVRNLRHGKSVVLVPSEAQLTTQSAANVLGVSRPHLVKLLEQGRIGFSKAGTHRRVLLKDLLEYMNKRDRERHEILDHLAKQALEEGSYVGTPIPPGGDDE